MKRIYTADQGLGLEEHQTFLVTLSGTRVGSGQDSHVPSIPVGPRNNK